MKSKKRIAQKSKSETSIQSHQKNSNKIHIILISLVAFPIIFLLSTTEPEDLLLMERKFKEIIELLQNQLKKSIYFQSKETQIKNKAILKNRIEYLNFASFKRGAELIDSSSFINSKSSILRSDSFSMLIASKALAETPQTFTIMAGEDFLLSRVEIILNDIFTNFPKEIHFWSSVDGKRQNWQKEGKIDLKDKVGKYVYQLNKSRVSRFIKFSVVGCHNNYNFYYCSINQILLLGLTRFQEHFQFQNNNLYNDDFNDHNNKNTCSKDLKIKSFKKKKIVNKKNSMICKSEDKKNIILDLQKRIERNAKDLENLRLKMQNLLSLN